MDISTISNVYTLGKVNSTREYKSFVVAANPDSEAHYLLKFAKTAEELGVINKVVKFYHDKSVIKQELLTSKNNSDIEKINGGFISVYKIPKHTEFKNYKLTKSKVNEYIALVKELTKQSVFLKSLLISRNGYKIDPIEKRILYILDTLKKGTYKRSLEKLGVTINLTHIDLLQAHLEEFFKQVESREIILNYKFHNIIVNSTNKLRYILCETPHDSPAILRLAQVIVLCSQMNSKISFDEVKQLALKKFLKELNKEEVRYIDCFVDFCLLDDLVTTLEGEFTLSQALINKLYKVNLLKI